MNKWAYFGKKSTKKMPILAKHANRDIQLVTFFIFLWKNLPQIMSLHIKSATHAIEYWKIEWFGLIDKKLSTPPLTTNNSLFVKGG